MPQRLDLGDRRRADFPVGEDVRDLLYLPGQLVQTVLAHLDESTPGSAELPNHLPSPLEDFAQRLRLAERLQGLLAHLEHLAERIRGAQRDRTHPFEERGQPRVRLVQLPVRRPTRRKEGLLTLPGAGSLPYHQEVPSREAQS
jgi:hypothetical protein